MPVYFYKAKKGPTEIVEGQITANSEDEVVGSLNEQGLVAVSIYEKNKKKAQKEQINAKLKISYQAVNVFTLQLAGLVKASVPILKALNSIKEQSEGKNIVNVINSIEKDIKDGKTLSDAFAKFPLIFSNLYVNMVKASEKAGALGEVLNNLADYQEQDLDLRHKIKSALTYPIFIFCVGIVTVYIMLTMFLPKLTVLYVNMKDELPWSTRMLISLSDFLSKNWIIIGVFVLLFLVVIKKLNVKNRLLSNFFKTKIPLVNIFFKNVEMVRFSRTLGLLVHNGIGLCEGLDLTIDVLENQDLKDKLKKVKAEIIQGGVLSNSLKNTKMIPGFVVSMIAVGEESGRIDNGLSQITQFYEKETQSAVESLTSLLEPILILVIGSIIGFIVFAMLLPVFNIGQTFK